MLVLLPRPLTVPQCPRNISSSVSGEGPSELSGLSGPRVRLRRLFLLRGRTLACGSNTASAGHAEGPVFFFFLSPLRRGPIVMHVKTKRRRFYRMYLLRPGRAFRTCMSLLSHRNESAHRSSRVPACHDGIYWLPFYCVTRHLNPLPAQTKVTSCRHHDFSTNEKFLLRMS